MKEAPMTIAQARAELLQSTRRAPSNDLVGALACAFRAAAEVALKNGITEKEFLRTAWACFRLEQDGTLPDIVPPKSWPPDVPGFPEELFWIPPPDHDDRPEAVAARLAAGEESDRHYDIRRNELLELEDEDFRPDLEKP